MGLDVSKLENVKRRGNNVIARCPACAEEGRDRKGEHLFIDNEGRFGCVLYPGLIGESHRKKIYELVGTRATKRTKKVRVTKTQQNISPKIIEKDILGRLGRFKFNHARKEKTNPYEEKVGNLNECKRCVPDVPNENKANYNLKEIMLLKDIDNKSLQKIHLIKQIFNGTVIKVSQKLKKD